MPTDYRQVLKELREEEDRLAKELDIIRDAIPAMEVMAAKMPAPPAWEAPVVPKKYAEMGPKEAIQHLLGQQAAPLMPADIAKLLLAGGIVTRSTDFTGNVTSTLNQMKAEGLVQRVEEGWRLTLKAQTIANPEFRIPWQSNA